MLRSALVDAWLLVAALLSVCGALAAILRSCTKPRRPIHPSSFILHHLHACESGSVQSLSFVLTVPVFIMLMLLAVQITQLMIGTIVVHYAAFAAARSATVWIPARVGMDVTDNGENRIGLRTPIQSGAGGELNQISPGGPKFEKIREAAALACVPIAPSRSYVGSTGGDPMTQSLRTMYAALSPTAATNPKISQRLANKWTYANAATNIQIFAFHRRYGGSNSAYQDEPPLWQLERPPDGYYQPGEIGWRDQIRVTVTHNFALLPGPGRLLARTANQTFYPDTVSPTIQKTAPTGVYWIPLSATATMVGEGEKSVRPYVY